MVYIYWALYLIHGIVPFKFYVAEKLSIPMQSFLLHSWGLDLDISLDIILKLFLKFLFKINFLSTLVAKILGWLTDNQALFTIAIAPHVSKKK